MDPIKKIINNIEIYYIPTKKFKTISCSFVFSNEFEREDFNERHILSDLLVDNMKKYPSSEERNKYLNSLYGLEAFGICTEIGDAIVNHFVVSYPNEKFLPDEKNLSEKAFNFLNEIVTNPKMNKGFLTAKSVKEKVDEAKQMYFSLRQQKPLYAQYQFLTEYYKNNPDRFRIFPDFNKLQNIDKYSVTKVYKKMLMEDNLKIFVIGDFDHDKMDSIIQNNLQVKRPEIIERPLKYNIELFDIKEVNKTVEYGDVTQSRIFLGYQVKVDYFSRLHPAMTVFETIFGGFDQARLFQTIREKMHLSYYVQTAYYAEEQILMVALGTNMQDQELAIAKVLEIQKDLQEGNIPDDLFELAKEYCLNTLKRRNDSQTSLLIQHIKSFLRFNKPYDYEMRLKKYEEVNKEEVLEAAKSIELNTIYSYTSGVKNDAK